MITKETLAAANDNLKTIDQKGKAYVMVNERVKAFRDIEPDGAITTEWLVLDFERGVAVSKTTITASDGTVLATGTAYEREGNGYVNKTSFVENCETSSTGRALGFLGIGIDSSMASADEVANAIVQQGGKELASDTEKKAFVIMCEQHDIDPEDILMSIGWKPGNKMTKTQHGKALLKLMEIMDD